MKKLLITFTILITMVGSAFAEMKTKTIAKGVEYSYPESKVEVDVDYYSAYYKGYWDALETTSYVYFNKFDELDPIENQWLYTASKTAEKYGYCFLEVENVQWVFLASNGEKNVVIMVFYGE